MPVLLPGVVLTAVAFAPPGRPVRTDGFAVLPERRNAPSLQRVQVPPGWRLGFVNTKQAFMTGVFAPDGTFAFRVSVVPPRVYPDYGRWWKRPRPSIGSPSCGGSGRTPPSSDGRRTAPGSPSPAGGCSNDPGCVPVDLAYRPPAGVYVQMKRGTAGELWAWHRGAEALFAEHRVKPSPSSADPMGTFVELRHRIARHHTSYPLWFLRYELLTELCRMWRWRGKSVRWQMYYGWVPDPSAVWVGGLLGGTS